MNLPFRRTVIIHCDYDEGDPSTYRGVYIKDDLHGGEIRYNSKDFSHDFKNLLYTAHMLGAAIILNSSSVDHYAMEVNRDHE